MELTIQCLQTELLGTCHVPGPLAGLWDGAYMNVKQANCIQIDKYKVDLK